MIGTGIVETGISAGMRMFEVISCWIGLGMDSLVTTLEADTKEFMMGLATGLKFSTADT